jgi:hypothetical protein
MRAIESDITGKVLAGITRPGATRVGERGTTLLEVLVVSLILLVGILTVIRVFPTGFDVVERGGYVTMANRYAKTLLDDLCSKPEALPDGVLPAVYLRAEYQGTRWWINDDEVQPSDLEARPPGTGDGGLRAWANSLVQFRRIHQETTRVPRAAYRDAEGNLLARYALRFAPIEFYNSETPGYYDLMTVYSLRSYTKVDRDSLERYAGRDGYYAIDPDEEDEQHAGAARQIYFSRVSYRRTFKIDFAVRPIHVNPNDYNPDAVEYVTDRIVWVDADSDVAMDAGGVVNLGDGTYTVLVPDSEVVRRRLRDARAEPGSGDPLWYRLIDPTVGLLEFGPGTAGLPVGINYSVMDWQILHDDVEVPLEADPGQTAPAEEQLAWVKLSFPFIERDAIGAPEDDRPGMQEAIILQNIDPNSPDYGKVIDPDNDNDGADDHATWTFDDPQRATDNSLAGRLGLRVAKFNQLGVRRVRVFYRTRDGFAAMVVKPYARYTQVPSTARVPSYNRYRSSGNRLYFALADVGKTVAVDYSYQDGTDGPVRRITGEMHTIRITRQTLDSDVGPSDYGFLDLNVPGGGSSIRSIDSVRGQSVEVRVVWPKRGMPNRMHTILQSAWSGELPDFWQEEKEGRMLVQSVSAVVTKPRDL